jgi:hypothetical protein
MIQNPLELILRVGSNPARPTSAICTSQSLSPYGVFNRLALPARDSALFLVAMHCALQEAECRQDSVHFGETSRGPERAALSTELALEVIICGQREAGVAA